jgi:hypothetical protein
VRRRSELFAAIALAAIGLLTLVWPDWIEGIFGVDPDAGSGAVEAAIVVVCALAAGALWLHRRVALRRAETSPEAQ